MINQIDSKEEYGKFIITLPIVDEDARYKIMCLLIFLIVDITFAILYFTTKETGCLIVFICLDLILGVYIRCKSCINDNPNKINVKQDVIMWRNIDSLFIMINNKSNEYPFENVKGFSNLKEKGKGIYLELVSGPVVKIVSYAYKDPVVERAALEFNKCLDKLRIKESLIPNDI